MTVLHIGFTGTRKGMSASQLRWLPFHIGGLLAMKEWNKLWFHHGDCIGADSDAHYIMADLGFKTHIHPPKDDEYRAWCRADIEDTPQDYLYRNRVIVGASSVIFACPAQNKEVMRGSGTWYTIRYARKFPVKILTVIPR